MKLPEIIMISVGLSLDVFAVVVCRGALLSRIDKVKTAFLCLLFAVCQVGALLLGTLLGRIPLAAAASVEINHVWRVCSMIIFAGLGVYMLGKAWKNKPILERRNDGFSVKEVCFLACATSLDAFFAGIGFALFRAELLSEAVSIAVVTVLAAALGTYAGYRLGYEQKTKAYSIGGILLIVAGVELFFRFQV